MRKLQTLVLAAALAFGMASGALAQGWTLKGALSTISFGSVKKDKVGETFRFSNISGKVDKDGRVTVTIDLDSVQTGVDIRDERMRKHVFGSDGKKKPTATLTVQVDPKTVTAVPVGALKPLSTTVELEFLGRRMPVEADLVIARLSPERIMVLTDGMIWFSTEDMGIDEGISKLQELAGLPSITRAFPVTARLVFQK